MGKSYKKILTCLFCIFIFTAISGTANADDFDPANPVMEDYYKTPAYISVAEKPSTMLILDSSGSMNSQAYRGSGVRSRRPGGRCTTWARGGDFDPLKEYYGYFDPKTYYVYNNNDLNNQYFATCSGSTCDDESLTWSGNFLNWLTMRRIDVAKQVLTGGKVDNDGTPHQDIREAERNPDRDYYKVYNDTKKITDLNGNTRYMTPWHQPLFTRAYNANPQYIRFYRAELNNECDNKATWDAKDSSAYYLDLDNDNRRDTDHEDDNGNGILDAGEDDDRDGKLDIREEINFNVRVKVDADQLINGSVDGIVQQSKTNIRFGLTIFDAGSDSPNWNGGEVRKYIGEPNSEIVTAINNTHPNSWTPLAETLWTVTGYFQQNSSGTGGTGPHYESDSYSINNTWDPFYFNDKQKKIPCSEGFVILLTDGESTQDLNIPKWLRDYDKDGTSRGSFGSNGSDYLDDVALYAHTVDLRPDATEPEMVGDQTITLYPVFAFGSGASLLERAAINGGFIDKNGDGRPNTLAEEIAITDLTKREWDFDNDPDHEPDNYAAAENGEDLVNALKKAIGDIMKRMASGTSASVISSSRSGEGAIYQAIYFPTRADGENREITWTGDTHALLVDAYGNMREDTLKNATLDMKEDYIIKMFFDDTDNGTKAKRFKDINGDGNLDVGEDIDGDGNLDVFEMDYDGDGNFDIIEDKNGDGDCLDDEDYDNDGNLDVIETDYDGDGNPDLNEDVDGDGYLDRGEDVICNQYIDTYEIDYNSNGILDAGEDIDGDGRRDLFFEDLDGDCNFDNVDEDLDSDNNFDKTDEDLNLNGLFDLDKDNNLDGDCADAGDVDTNGNGICDPYEDLDNDGRFETGEDTNHNNVLDAGEDLDGDGELDRSEDLDNDDNFDVGEDKIITNNILDSYEDLNSNNSLDRTEDLNGDGNFDRGEDRNCNGSLEDREDIDDDGKFDVDEDLNGNSILDLTEDLDGDGKLDVGEDANCNGIADDPDLNGNGLWDTNEDVDGDGHLDVAETDVDGDGNPDVAEDLDGDGNLDRGEDLNCNGVIDAGEDKDGDGILDKTEDLDGDGRFDKYNEDINNDGRLDVYEDVDNDGNLDIFEDLDGDGRFEDACEEDNNPANGILDAAEDQDGDGHRDCGEDLNGNGTNDANEPDTIPGGFYRDEDIDNDGRADVFEDKDGDGVLDLVEDANHDGIANDPDLNGNGRWDLKEDLDGDGNIDVNEDLDGDNAWDLFHEDLDDDCRLDVEEDIDKDGKLDTANEDLDGDGFLDAIYEDVNNNCKLDTDSEDIDGDGKLDVKEWDIDGDGRVDGHEDLDYDCNLDVLEDIDGDGKFDTVNEDANNDGILDVKEADVDGDNKCDLVADIDVDGDGNFDVDEDIDGDGKLDVAEPMIDIVNVLNLKYLWSAGKQLADTSMLPANTPSGYGTSAPERYIFTYIDKDNNGTVDFGEIKSFDSTTLATDQYFGYFLGTNTGTDRDINKDGSVDNNDVATLIDYIRGKDFPGTTTIRSRQLRIDTNGDGVENSSDSVVTWRLGDIIQSTPTVVQRPAENLDLLYKSNSYRKFKKAYVNRRTMIYTGSNDGLFHGFNGGFYRNFYIDPTTSTITRKKFWRDCSVNILGITVCNDSTSSPALGQEMWAYAPYNILPHLQWLTKFDYTHVYYNDLKPKVFDAQLWPDAPLTDPVHVGGWGTIMIAGMSFGGGPIEINANEGSGGTDKRILRSSYFILDVTDPEQPPALLGEIVLDDDSRFSFTTAYPAVIPMYDPQAPANAWGEKVPLEWYLLFGNGPTNMKGESDQEGRVFIMKLKNYQCNGQGISCLNKTLGSWEDNGRSDGTEYFTKLGEPNSFMGDPVVVDYQLGKPSSNPGAFMADAAYFGTIAGNFNNNSLDSNIGEDLNGDGTLDYGEDANGNGQLDVDEDLDGDGNLDSGEDVGGWTGRLHRIVFDDRVNSTGEEPTDPDTWTHSLLFDPQQPIIANPTVGVDKKGNFWVYFGTGRLFDTLDKEDDSLMDFYGIMEPRDYPPSLTANPNYSGSMSSPARSKSDLLDSTLIKVYEGDTATSARVKNAPTGVDYFNQLEALFDYNRVTNTPPSKKGWYIDLLAQRERNIGRAALFGEVITFTTYIPSNAVCEAEGSSNLYAAYYRTGTSYWRSIIGLDPNDQVNETIGPRKRTKRKTSLGPGLSLTPNIFRGREGETTAFIQTSTGEIKQIEQANPGIVKSGKASWKQAD